MALEETLAGWTGPSSDTEQDKQDRTERMVREAIDNHPAFEGCSRSVYAKGSYANDTNVRADSDVDIAVQCHEVFYWEEEKPDVSPAITPYTGIWTPQKLRTEVGLALRSKFGNQVDASGSTACTVRSSDARVDADVVPCFDYFYYFPGGSRAGTRIFPKTGSSFENFPQQQLRNGEAKDRYVRTGINYKACVRILKRVENVMAEKGVHRRVPSFFIECLVNHCPDEIFRRYSWTNRISGILTHIWEGLQGPEPDEESDRWLEVNECKFLFYSSQDWNRADGRDFAYAAWNYLELGS